jgi:hypothetical protein
LTLDYLGDAIPLPNYLGGCHPPASPLHYTTADKFIGMELLQYRVKKPQVTTKDCRTEPKSPGIPQNWTTLIPGGKISEILLSQKRFLSITIKHRQSKTMLNLARPPGFIKP